ncbi:MAG: Ger(x)C family spore germination protein [Clostridiaceae bacterium]|nr:Ger(x)C family spore germination protein [Clostridiaceae bacterium]
MKRLWIAFIVILSLLLGGCYSYNDINRVLFPTAMIIDIDDEGDIMIYLEIFHAFRSTQENTEQGQRILYQQKGATFLEAIESFDEIAAHVHSFEHNKVIIFTEKAAEEGIEDFLDFLQRGQQFLLRPFVAVYYGEPKDLFEVPLKQNEYLGLYIHDLFDRPRTRITIRHRKLYEVLNDRRRGENVALITAIEVDKNALDDIVKKYGVAVIQNDKLVDRVDLWEMQTLAFLIDTVESGRISIPHPQHEGKHITLEILKSNTKTEVNYEEGKIHLKKKIDMKTIVGGSEGSLVLDQETIEKIDYLLEETLKENLHEFFHKYREKDVDIFEVQQNFERNYPHIEVDNAIEITELEIEVNNHLSGSTDSLNFQ